jgi:putative tricarboxylic transport membrane protein
MFDATMLYVLASHLPAIFLGLFVGIFFGALPGLGMIVGITLLLPLSYNMDAVGAILMLLAVYQGAEYGGSISAIVLKIPGTAMAAPIMIDGVPMAEQQSPGKALAYSLYGSTFGGLFGAMVLILFAMPIAALALKLGDAEIFLLGLLGLIAVSGLAEAALIKSLIAVVLGLLVGTIGIDLMTGLPRLTMGLPELYDGPNLIAVVVGLFAVSEVLNMASARMDAAKTIDPKNMRTNLTLNEIRHTIKAMLTGSTVGVATGVLPGVGSTISSWLAYAAAKKIGHDKASFGRGAPEGIVAPDAANNATVGGALLPFLALGIPGSASIAIIAGAFVIHGVQPGPQLMRMDPQFIQDLFVGFVVTTVCMFFMGRFLTTLFARALTIPNSILAPTIAALSLCGVYISSSNFFDLWLAFGLGVATFFLRKLGYPIANFILALILAPIIEKSFRRALTISEGNYEIFIGTPTAFILCLIAFGLMIGLAFRFIRKNATNARP